MKLSLVIRTSPISIGAAQSSAQSNHSNYRQRKESSSSLSVGSWQMISDTGSLRSQTDSHIVVLNEQQQQQQINVSSNNNNNHHYAHNIASNFQSAIGSSSAASSTSAVNGSSTDTRTIIDDDCFTANEYFRRRERLNEVRTLFYNCYSSTIGYKFKNGGDSATLGSLLGNFAEKVGLKTPI